MRTPLTPRRTVALVVLLLVSPAVASGVAHHATTTPAPDRPTAPVDPANLTVVTTQGTHFHGGGLNPGSGRMAGVRSSNGSVVWTHDEYGWYYDADPVTNRTLLFVAHDRVDGHYVTFAVEWNWVTGEAERRFRLPGDTHDVDRLGPHRYAVADKADHRAFVYNYTADDPPRRATDEVRWEFRFREHFPPAPDAGWPDDYTHLNDVDVIHGGDAFMLSPRNFNRVVAVNRSTKEVIWTLGDQDDTSILDGQHHPVVLDEDPLTLLVGDSENNRVVEYQWVCEAAGTGADVETGGSDDAATTACCPGPDVEGHWERTWAYGRGLNWPRGVQRLPNGNTVIADTGNDRVVEVTPNGTVVREYRTAEPHPYDGYRLTHGEGEGPPMARVLGENASARTGDGRTGLSTLEYAHRTVGWVLPVWVGERAFLGLVLAALLTVGWALTEAGLAVRRRV
ncbi:MAG: aryl-sulfate sulfotransferase [Haloarculaceae archaeon]